jgi:hypothetical protein
VLVVHGVGQQTKFETLDSLVRGLVRTILPAPLDQPRARLVQLAGERLNRVELTFKREGRDSEIHLYEAYWASLTEGRVTLRDVVYLLLFSAVNGVRNGTTHFQRWLFGRIVSFPPQIRTVIALIVGLLTLLALVIVNMTIGVVAAARWGFGTRQGVVGDGLYGDLSTALNLLFVLVVSFVAVLGIGRVVRNLPNPVRLAAGGLGIVAFGAALAGTIAVGVAIPLLFFLHPQTSAAADLPLLPAVLGIRLVDRFNAFVELATVALVLAAAVVCGVAFLVRLLRAWQSPAAPEGRRGVTLFIVLLFAALLVGLAVEIAGLGVPDQGRPAGAGALGRGAVWMLLVAASLVVRRVVVQYVGDLVAYVQPHTLDRFQVLRDQIKTDVYNRARALYRAGDELGFTYQRVAIVGHSLGSVVAYDVLNRLIAEDELVGPKSSAYLDVVKRTSILLTFGSPLDKTAFAFGAQRKQTATRFALAATQQPLIQRTDRPEWVNVYSPWDPISGKLDFYDPPAERNGEPHPKAVRNRQDMDARTLLFAHNEYWSDPLVFDTLLDALDPR